MDESKYKLQLKTRIEQDEIEQMLPGWICVSFGYSPNTQEDILVFEKNFKSELDWTNFLNSDSITETIDLREV